jgi:hypothetical protein
MDAEDGDRYWKKGTEEIEDVVEINEEEEEETRSEEGRRRGTPLILWLPLQLSPEDNPKVLSEGQHQLPFEQMPSEERTRVMVSEQFQARMDRLRDV